MRKIPMRSNQIYLMKKLKKGTRKYKGKIPIICFNYGKIGHFSNKCPYPKQEESDDEITFKYQKKIKTDNKNIFFIIFV